MSSKIYNMSSKPITEKQIYLRTGILPYKMFITAEAHISSVKHLLIIVSLSMT